jgi:4-amino-4-deoxy-L-arabinose transferase-like glycosyltransferase
VLPLADERLSRADTALLLLAGLPLFLCLDHSLWGSEGRWLFIAGEMLSSGDWLEPNLQGRIYADKPLLSYWAIALLGWPFGGVNEVTARAPSALAGAASILLTGWIAARLMGRRSAVAAGWILATSFSFVYWARSASADLLNLLAITAALALYVQSMLRLRSWQLPVFFLILAVGGHAKGTPAIIIPLAVAGADVILSRRWEVLRHWRSAALGMVLAAGVYALPFVLSYWHRGDWELTRLMWRENFVRAFDAFDHQANPLYYFYVFPAMFLPWSAWLAGALAWAGRRWSRERGLRFALVAFATILLVFTASESRRSYYILPIFPWAALLVAEFWRGLIDARAAGRRPSRLQWLLGVLPLACFAWLMAALAFVALIGRWLPGDAGALLGALPSALPWSVLGVAVALATVSLQRRGRLRAAFAGALLIAFLFFLYFATGIQALREAHAMERPFAAQVQRRFPQHPIVYYQGGIGANLQYYLGPGPELRTPEEIAELLAQGGGALVAVCGRDNSECLADAPGFTATRVLQVSTPAIGSAVAPKDKYSLFLCRRR